MTLVRAEDSQEVLALKLRLWNLRAFLTRDLSREHFEQASAELKAIWAAWAELEQRETL